MSFDINAYVIFDPKDKGLAIDLLPAGNRFFKPARVYIRDISGPNDMTEFSGAPDTSVYVRGKALNQPAILLWAEMPDDFVWTKERGKAPKTHLLRHFTATVWQKAQEWATVCEHMYTY